MYRMIIKCNPHFFKFEKKKKKKMAKPIISFNRYYYFLLMHIKIMVFI